MKNKYLSYIFSREINGTLIPHHEQNNEIRKYCLQQNIDFPLANTEVVTSLSWFVLRSVLEEAQEGTSILVYSKDLITTFDKNILEAIHLVNEKSLDFHFCREDEVISASDIYLHLDKLRNLNRNRELSFFEKHHTSTQRNYFERMNKDKPSIMEVSKKFAFDYWDGDRSCGYGGYRYDGRWESIARKIIEHYELSNKSCVLDLGCGKGYLLYELKKILPGLEVTGLDISSYAIENSKVEVSNNLSVCDIRNGLSFEDKSFDLILSLMTLHNFEIPELEFILGEISRVSKSSYLSVESYRNETELTNLQCWALTCEAFFSPRSWKYIFDRAGYMGDYEFLYFE